MRINQNISAMSATRHAAANQAGVGKAMERLSSGLRVNRAADDAAGLAISEGLRAQVNGMTQGVQNTRDGISLLQAAEGNLNETHAVLQRMRTLTVQAANGTNSHDNLQQIQAEMTQLMAEIDHIADSTQFNGMPLLDGSFHDKLFQVDANAGDTKSVTIGHRLSGGSEAVAPQLALWGLDDPAERAKLPVPFVVEQTITATGETVTASVGLDPLPASASELADQLRADPTFSANFDVTLGDWNEPGKPPRPGVNVVISAKEPGAGAVTVPGTGAFTKTKSRTGQDEKPAEYGGFHAAELLGGAIDVTRQAGSSTVTIEHPPSAGGVYESEDIGDAGWGVVPPSPGSDPTVYTNTWPSGATDAIGRIDRAIARVSTGRAELGAMQNGLEHTMHGVGVAAENLAVSESRIRDADIAKEVTDLQRWQTLCQSALSMLTQANKAAEPILSLLKRVGTFIFGRPRRFSRDRRAHPASSAQAEPYTLIWEEPH